SLSKTGSATIVGTVVSNASPPNSTTSLTADFNLAGVTTGAWTVNATTSSGTGSYSSFNIVAPQPPTLSTFAPPAAHNNAVLVGAQLFGSNFVVGGTTVVLTRTPTTITATNVVVASDGTSLTCDLDLRCAPVGNYDGRVTTSAGSGTET